MSQQIVIRLPGERNSLKNFKAFKESIPKPQKYEVLIKVHSEENTVKAFEYLASGAHIGKVCIKLVNQD